MENQKQIEIGDYLLAADKKMFKKRIYKVIDKWIVEGSGLTEVHLASIDDEETFSYPLMFANDRFLNIGKTPSPEILYGAKSQNYRH